MTKYIVWYKKEITANNIKQCVQKESKIKPLFHSIIEEKEEIKQGVDAIGFNYNTPYTGDDFEH
jgi:hypothetical protein